MRLDKLITLQLQDLYLDKLNEGLWARTVRYVHVTIIKALNDAVRWDQWSRETWPKQPNHHGNRRRSCRLTK